MAEPKWRRYPRVAEAPRARTWLKVEANLGHAENTIDAYGRGLEEYLAFCDEIGIDPEVATRAHVAGFVDHLRSRPNAGGENVRRIDSGAGLSNSTLQQRLTAVRLFYDHLVEEGLREDNPVGRGRYTPGKGFAGARGILPRYNKLPWIPSDEQWLKVLKAFREERLRDRLMLAFAYDCALRREELCSLRTEDLDPAHRTLRVRAETTKGRSERVVPYSEPTAELYRAYLPERRQLSRASGPLLLSESRRNRGMPVTIWTWSKVARKIALRSGVDRFSPHTLRHLCLTDLARAGWDIHEIASFAGHTNTQTTLQYIHLSGRDLAKKFERGMAQIHAWRVRSIDEDASPP
ncbi:MAG: tyrosine-type recombinase/integrase [Actinomycetota bacterium]